MKSYLYLPVVIFQLSWLILFPLNAQEDGAKTLLWEIKSEKIEQPSYLFGTMHIIPKKDFKSFDLADSLLLSSQTLVMEMELYVPLKVQMEWAKMMLLPEGKLISDFMDPADFERIKSYSMDSLGVKEFLFNTYIKLKPFAFYSALIPHAIGEKIEGFELHYSEIAKKKKIPVHGLESFEFQLSIFDSIPNSKQLNMFFSGPLNLRQEMDEMLELYFEQDIYKMASMISDENSAYAEFESQLLSLRNENWSEILDELISQNSCFIAVGAAHLAGRNGLIGLLREAGYEVNPVCLQPGCK